MKYGKNLFAIILLLLTLSCATTKNFSDDPTEEVVAIKKLIELGPPQQKVVVAVYSFGDLTGQRKTKGNVALFSTAVSQGAENWLIKSLQDAGDGAWFTVVERTNLDNLIQERQLIRNQRETYIGDNAKILKPLLYAGIIIEGGILAYDTNIVSGGIGARYFAIGANTQYRKDQVTVSLRAISTQTGEVLLSINTVKTILSLKAGIDTIKFLDMDTQSLEIETGLAENEPVSYAVRSAIEQAVINMIEGGNNKNLWKYRG